MDVQALGIKASSLCNDQNADGEASWLQTNYLEFDPLSGLKSYKKKYSFIRK